MGASRSSAAPTPWRVGKPRTKRTLPGRGQYKQPRRVAAQKQTRIIRKPTMCASAERRDGRGADRLQRLAHKREARRSPLRRASARRAARFQNGVSRSSNTPPTQRFPPASPTSSLPAKAPCRCSSKVRPRPCPAGSGTQASTLRRPYSPPLAPPAHRHQRIVEQ